MDPPEQLLFSSSPPISLLFENNYQTSLAQLKNGFEQVFIDKRTGSTDLKTFLRMVFSLQGGLEDLVKFNIKDDVGSC